MKNKFLKTLINILKVTGIILLYFFLQVFLLAIFKVIYPKINMNNILPYLLIIYIITIFIIALFFRKTLLKDLKSFKMRNLKIGFKNWFIGFILMCISNLYLTVFVFDGIASNEATNRQLISSSPVLAIVLLAIVAPLLEEIVFRLNTRKISNKKWVYCITSGLIFGFMHVASGDLKEMLFIIPYSILGISFAKTYYETNNIYTSYITHGFHNLLSILVIIGGNLL